MYYFYNEGVVNTFDRCWKHKRDIAVYILLALVMRSQITPIHHSSECCIPVTTFIKHIIKFPQKNIFIGILGIL